MKKLSPNDHSGLSNVSRFMTDNEVATWFNCGRSTVWRLARSGQIPKPVKIHGMTRWDRLHLEAHAATISCVAGERG